MENNKLDLGNVVDVCISELNLTEYDELIPFQETTSDGFGIPSPDSRVRSIKYQQYYKNLPVKSAILIVHSVGGEINLLYETLVPDLDIDISYSIFSGEALSLAIQAVNGNPIWQDEHFLNNVCVNEEGSFDTSMFNRYLPVTTLCVSRKSDKGLLSENMLLVWECQFVTTDNYYKVLVDAKSGEIIEIIESRVSGQYGWGDVSTLYDGYKNSQLETFKCDFCIKWKLKDSNGNETRLRGRQVKSSNNIWVDDDSKPATTAHWIMKQLAIFYASTYNNLSLVRDIYVNTGLSFNNAYYDEISNDLLIGEAPNGNSYSTIDIVGHEVAHKLTHFTANLEYHGESGALNESFSDIFGVLSEKYIRTRPFSTMGWNWTIGEDASELRSLSNPEIHNQPSYYHGTFWADTTNLGQQNDYGHVHTNSGVQNKWFYNLSEAIGVDAAGMIAYYTLSTFLMPTSKYIDAYYGSINAATFLYGICSDERRAVISAWYDVGVMAFFPRCPTDHYHFNKYSSKKVSPSIFPNPSTDFVNVVFPDEVSNVKITLFDNVGNRILAKRFDGGFLSLPISHLSNGLYFLQIMNEDNIQYFKIIKN